MRHTQWPLGDRIDVGVRRLAFDGADKEDIEAEFATQHARDTCGALGRLRIVDTADDYTVHRILLWSLSSRLARLEHRGHRAANPCPAHLRPISARNQG